MFKPVTSQAIACLGLVTTLALTGCSVGVSDENKEQVQSAKQTSTQQQAQPEDSGSMDQENEPTESAEATSEAPGAEQDDDAEGAGTDEGVTADSMEPLASVTVPFTKGNDDEATLTVELLSVQRKGKLIEAIYGFTVKTDVTDLSSSVFDANGSQFFPYLIDQKNLNRHSLVKDASDNSGDIRLIPNRRATGNFTFPAPPEDVHEMDFHLWEGSEMAKDVKID